MTIILKNKDTLQFKNFNFKCSIGKRGLTSRKIEGDKKTPLGIFSIDKLYFRKDRIKNPKTLLKCIPIKKNMGWCNDPKNKKTIINPLRLIKKLVMKNYIDLIQNII